MLLSKDELIEKEKEADERCLKLEKEVSRMQEERSALHENVKKSETELTRANELCGQQWTKEARFLQKTEICRQRCVKTLTNWPNIMR